MGQDFTKVLSCGLIPLHAGGVPLMLVALKVGT